jgi:hypothetical protein
MRLMPNYGRGKLIKRPLERTIEEWIGYIKIDTKYYNLRACLSACVCVCVCEEAIHFIKWHYILQAGVELGYYIVTLQRFKLHNPTVTNKPIGRELNFP